jgi:hypothetical protein
MFREIVGLLIDHWEFCLKIYDSVKNWYFDIMTIHVAFTTVSTN